MKKFFRAYIIFSFLCSLALATDSSKDKSNKPDAVSGATSTYSSGDRGPVPPKNDDYEVLGAKEGIKSWAIKYDNVLIRGGEFYDDKAADALKEWGVKTIISIAPSEKERDFCKKFGFKLVEIPFDKKQGPSNDDIRKFLETIKKEESPFYLHCVGGTHRGGVMGFAYRIHVLGWDHNRALVEFGRLGGDLKEDHNMLEAVRNFKPETIEAPSK